MGKEMIERCVSAAKAKRYELINAPLDRCYEAIVLAVVAAMLEPTEAMLATDEVHTKCLMCGGHKEGYQRLLCSITGDVYND